MFAMLVLVCGADPTFVVENKCPPAFTVINRCPDQPSVVGDAAPTPHSEVARVLSLLPKPKIGFVDFGCGDARWCIAAAQKWGCKVTGIEIDPARAAAAKERVRNAGLAHLITIIHGDAITTEYYDADVGVAYLWPDVLEKLKPRIEKLTAFASYQHQPPGLSVTKNGDSWFYTKPAAAPALRTTAAVWGGQVYSGPLCNSPNCAMCQSIRAQLASTVPQQASAGQWARHCSNGKCWYEWVQ